MYESFYKLRAKPFRLSPDSGFFYPSRGHKRALAYLRYGLSQGEGFVVITGAPGTGKTTLAQILLKEMDQRHLVVAHLTTTQLEADDMLRMVAASFGLRYEGMDKAGLLKTLEAFLMARSRDKKRALLVVDEAQNLPARSLEELRMLSNLQVGDRALLQTFLLGQPQFRQMLEHPDLEQLRQRVIANYHLSPLATDECKSYVESRLNQVGWQNDPSFTQQAYETIYEFSEGIPRRINMLCDRVLLFSFLEELHEVNNVVLQQVTDELGQEISGRTLPPERPAENLVHKNLPDIDETSHKPVRGEDALKNNKTREMPPHGAVPDKSERLDAALQEQKDARIEIEDDFRPDVSETGSTNDVFELASAEPSLHNVEKSRVADAEPPASEGSTLDRVVPDDGWTQPQALVDTAESEEDPSAAVAQAGSPDPSEKSAEGLPKPGQADRFRVIPGGRAADKKKRESLVLAPLPDAPGDTEEVTTRKILRLVLAFHRSPRSFPGLDDPSQPLPRGVRNILQLAIAEDDVLSNLRQISVMGISPAMLRAAVRFFVRRVMFVPGGDNYRVLGLRRDASLSEVEVNYGLLMRLLRHDNAEVVDGGVNRVGTAYEQLCQGEKSTLTATDEESSALNAAEAIDAAGNLDLDVAPKVEDGVKISAHQATGQEESYVEIDEGNSGSLFRNVILVAGLVVVLLVLYVTQIRGLDGTRGKGSETTPAIPTPQIVPDSPVSAVESSTDGGEEVNSERLSSPQNEPSLSQGSLENTISAVMPGEANDETSVESLAGQDDDVVDMNNSAILAAEAEARAVAEARVREKAAAEARVREKAAAEAKLKAEREERLRAETRAKERAKAKEEAKARAKAEVSARALATAKLETGKEKPTVLAKAETVANGAAKSLPVVSALTETDLAKVLDHFVSYYENGDIDQLMLLFSAKARTDTQTTRKGIRAEFSKVFATSDKRNIGFTGLSWKREDTFARGHAKFQTMVLPKDASTPVLTSGKVTVQVIKGGIGPQISRLYFSDVEIVENPVPVTDRNNPDPLAEDDLNPLMAALVTYYEAGDINAFMDLFSQDASSNDRATVDGIRTDYEGLFESTFKRRMELRNLTWMLDGSIARGEANYRVSVQPEKNVSPVIYNGTLWVQVESNKGLARITHFAFVE